MTSLRVGLAGTGAWARQVHAPGLRDHPSVDFVGVWGRSIDGLVRVADEAEVTAFQDLDALLSAVDALVVAVAPAAQLAIATRALARGAHLLLEKPTAEDPAAADDLLRIVSEQHSAAMVCLPRFFDPEHAVWLDEVRRHEWSRGEVIWHTSAMLPGSAFHTAWRDQAGAIFDVGPHIISQLERVLGPISQADMTGGGSNVTLAFRHGPERTSTADIDLESNAPRSEHYLFSGAAFGLEREAAIDFPAAYRALVDEFIRQTVTPGMPFDEPWLIGDSTRAVHIMHALRRAGSWTASSR